MLKDWNERCFVDGVSTFPSSSASLYSCAGGCFAASTWTSLNYGVSTYVFVRVSCDYFLDSNGHKSSCRRPLFCFASHFAQNKSTTNRKRSTSHAFWSRHLIPFVLLVHIRQVKWLCAHVILLLFPFFILAQSKSVTYCFSLSQTSIVNKLWLVLRLLYFLIQQIFLLSPCAHCVCFRYGFVHSFVRIQPETSK